MGRKGGHGFRSHGRSHGIHSHGIHSHGIHSHGIHSHGIHSHGIHSHGMHSHGIHSHSRGFRRSSSVGPVVHYPPPDVAFTLELIGHDAACGFPCCNPATAQVSATIPAGLQGYMTPEEYETMAGELNASLAGSHWPLCPTSCCPCGRIIVQLHNFKRLNNCKAVLAKQDLILKERGLFWHPAGEGRAAAYLRYDRAAREVFLHSAPRQDLAAPLPAPPPDMGAAFGAMYTPEQMAGYNQAMASLPPEQKAMIYQQMQMQMQMQMAAMQQQGNGGSVQRVVPMAPGQPIVMATATTVPQPYMVAPQINMMHPQTATVTPQVVTAQTMERDVRPLRTAEYFVGFCDPPGGTVRSLAPDASWVDIPIPAGAKGGDKITYYY